MNTCEDFFELITNAHILAAAMQKFGMSKLTDPLPSELFPSGQELSQKERFGSARFSSSKLPKRKQKKIPRIKIMSLNMQKKL